MENLSPSSPKKVLIVDDEMRMRRVITDYLRIKGYDTIEAGDGVEALERFAQDSPDLVLLDVMMPRMDGWEVCRHIRAKSQVPIIMLTAKGEEEDELQGFELGVDEYISKPFSLKILLARIEAVLRRGSPASPAALPVSVPEGLTVDMAGREVRVNGQPVELTLHEFEIVALLASRPQKVFTRQEIFEQVWNQTYFVEDKTINVHISNIRAKLRPTGTDGYIRTVWGIGFKCEG